jgi:hypothetical protein
MNTRYLFPNKFKKFGWGIMIFAFVAHAILMLSGVEELRGLEFKVFAIAGGDYHNHYFCLYSHNETQDILGILFIIGGILAAFSKQKNEDEYISKIRLESLLWATYINYGLLLLAILTIYGLAFLEVMMYNMFTLLIIFMIRFNYIIYKTRKAARYEK